MLRTKNVAVSVYFAIIVFVHLCRLGIIQDTKFTQNFTLH